MRWIRSLLLTGVLVGTSGCLGGDPLEGMWLFRFDPNTQLAGTCADDADSDAEMTYLGEDLTWVDIYSGGSGGYIVLIDEYLVGTVEDDVLTAAWGEVVTGDGFTLTSSVDLTATRDGGTMTGSVVSYEKDEVDGADDYDCRSTSPFTAERSVSDPDSYDVGDEV